MFTPAALSFRQAPQTQPSSRAILARSKSSRQAEDLQLSISAECKRSNDLIYAMITKNVNQWDPRFSTSKCLTWSWKSYGPNNDSRYSWTTFSERRYEVILSLFNFVLAFGMLAKSSLSRLTGFCFRVSDFWRGLCRILIPGQDFQVVARLSCYMLRLLVQPR
jgi:hypothetical protein